MTSKQKIVNRINEVGYVDNFWCIDNRITTRLGAVIFTLKKAGWDFKTEMHEKNCWYVCVKKPDSVKETTNHTGPQGFNFVYKVHEPVTKINWTQ